MHQESKEIAKGQFDIQLIPEFSAAATNLQIVQWLKNVKLVCELCNIQEIRGVILLQLRGGVLATYRQISKEQL